MSTIVIIVTLLIPLVLATDAEPRLDVFLKPPPFRLQKSQPYRHKKHLPPEEPTFISKLASWTSWLFPFGQEETTVPPITYDSPPPSPQYLPPNPSQYLPPSPPKYLPPPIVHQYSNKPCNSCNKEPWIPIAGHSGAGTIFGFVQPSEFKLPTPSIGQHVNIKHINIPPLPPQLILNNQKPELLPPLTNDAPPLYAGVGFKPPQPFSTYGAPHGGTTGSGFGITGDLTPPKDIYAPSETYGPPPIISNPPHYGHYGAPPVNPPQSHYGGPPANPLQSHYGAPPANPPQSHYGAPPANPPQSHYGVPPPNTYGEPPPGFVDHGSLSAFMKPPSLQYSPPTNSYGPPLSTHGAPPAGVVDLSSNPIETDSPLNLPPSGNYGEPPLDFTGIGSSGSPHPSNIVTPLSTEYLPPPVTLPISHDSSNPLSKPLLQQLTSYNSDFQLQAIPFPNMSPSLVAPIHNAKPFENHQDNIPEQVSKVEVHTKGNSNVDIIKSIPLLDYTASIEYPVKIIQSPIIDLVTTQDSEKNNPVVVDEPGVDLSKNPIVVDEHYAEASELRTTTQNLTDKNTYKRGNDGQTGNHLNGSSMIEQLPPQKAFKQFNLQNGVFNAPVMDYSQWLPSPVSIPTSMIPPPNKLPVWNHNPKKVQIIIPYTSNKNQVTHLNPVSTASDTVSNIRDILKDVRSNVEAMGNVPFDVLRLQIDDWTQQEYSNKINDDDQKATTSSKFAQSKIIPDDYLTTKSYDSTTPTSNDIFDHEPAGSLVHTVKDLQNLTVVATINDEYLETNIIVRETTPLPKSSTTEPKWDKLEVALSPVTKEKVYVVTPQPTNDHIINNSTGFRLEKPQPIYKEERSNDSKNIKVVYSEWPHLINELETTTSASKAAHPLWGSMELATLKPSEGVQLHSGHSKVVTVVTPSSTSKKKTGLDEKKAATKTAHHNSTKNT